MKTEIEKKQEDKVEANNMKTMREALEKIRDTIMNGGFDGRSPAYFVNYCDAALAKPPRNCDRYATPDEAELAFDDYCHDRRENPVEVCRRKSCCDCQREWLYAVAKEGETK